MNNVSDSDSHEQTVELKIKPSQVAIVALTLLAVIGAALVVLRLMDLLILVFVALVIAATIRPMKTALQHKRIPKGLAVMMIYLGILGVLVALFVLVIPVLIDQGGALIRGLPQVYASLISSLQNSSIDFIRTLPQRLPTGDQLGSQLQAASGSILTSVLGIGAGVLAFLGQLLSVIILSIYLTLDQSRLERFWLSLAPTKRRQELLSIWREIETRLGTYVRGEILLMTSIGVLAGLGYWVIGLPYPLALGVLAGLLEFVPMVGPTLGAIPAVLVALAISPQAALLVVLYSVVIQVTENNILVPRMMGKSVGVSPVMVIVAIFAFTSLLGIAGAFLAIPLAAVFQVLMDHIVVHAGVVGIEDTDEGGTNIMDSMRAQIRRLRAEGLQRLRAGRGRINLTTGDRDDVDSQADYLLKRADQALTEAVQSEATDTAEEHTAHLAEVDLVINQAGVMVEEAKAEAESGLKSKVANLAEAEIAIDHAGEMVEEAKAEAAIGRESENTVLVEANLAVNHAAVIVKAATAEAVIRRESEDALLDKVDLAIDHAGEMIQEAKADSKVLAGHELENTK
jgi:predicted PurR-regulated permease PerM